MGDPVHRTPPGSSPSRCGGRRGEYRRSKPGGTCHPMRGRQHAPAIRAQDPAGPQSRWKTNWSNIPNALLRHGSAQVPLQPPSGPLPGRSGGRHLFAALHRAQPGTEHGSGTQAIYAADYGATAEPKPLVDVDKAIYLVGSKLPGVMTKQSKVAFSSRPAAKRPRPRRVESWAISTPPCAPPI